MEFWGCAWLSALAASCRFDKQIIGVKDGNDGKGYLAYTPEFV